MQDMHGDGDRGGEDEGTRRSALGLHDVTHLIATERLRERPSVKRTRSFSVPSNDDDAVERVQKTCARRWIGGCVGRRRSGRNVGTCNDLLAQKGGASWCKWGREGWREVEAGGWVCR